MLKTFDIIVAVDNKNGIGKNGFLPWNLPGDMRHFKAVTTATQAKERMNAVIMGRKTWESIPEKFRPLVGRLNIVLTTNSTYQLPSSVLKAYSLDVALDVVSSGDHHRTIDQVFVIGGASVYTQAVNHSQCRRIFVTKIDADFSCDVMFPSLGQEFRQIACSREEAEGPLTYRFVTYAKN